MSFNFDGFLKLIFLNGFILFYLCYLCFSSVENVTACDEEQVPRQEPRPGAQKLFALLEKLSQFRPRVWRRVAPWIWEIL